MQPSLRWYRCPKHWEWRWVYPFSWQCLWNHPWRVNGSNWRATRPNETNKKTLWSSDVMLFFTPLIVRSGIIDQILYYSIAFMIIILFVFLSGWIWPVTHVYHCTFDFALIFRGFVVHLIVTHRCAWEIVHEWLKMEFKPSCFVNWQQCQQGYMMTCIAPVVMMIDKIMIDLLVYFCARLRLCVSNECLNSPMDVCDDDDNSHQHTFDFDISPVTFPPASRQIAHSKRNKNSINKYFSLEVK